MKGPFWNATWIEVNQLGDDEEDDDNDDDDNDDNNKLRAVLLHAPRPSPPPPSNNAVSKSHSMNGGDAVINSIHILLGKHVPIDEEKSEEMKVNEV